MCPHELCRNSLYAHPQSSKGFYAYRVIAGVLLIFIFSLAFGYTHAQNLGEEYISVQKWALPGSALLLSELRQNEDVYLYKDKPFNGWAYERFPNGNLQRAVSLYEGKQNGLMLMWYPDGKPQMSANYAAGYLHGRFLGWYNNGGVIYDMVINKGAYAGDSLLDNDDSRSASDPVILEGEGQDNDNSPE